MPNLSELTDYNPQDQVTPQGRLYVSPSIPTNDDGDYFTKPVAPMPELPADNVVERIIKKLAETEFSGGTDIGNKLAGTGGQERYQLWPEKIVRSALTAIPDAYSGKIPMNDVDPETGELVPSQAMIGRAMDMASFAGAGGVGGTGEGGAVLGAGPSLRPALKYKDRLYKGKEGQEHQDVIPPHLYPEFQKMAMSGEDISHYNFGFVNDKGHFLSREDALKYGIDSGLIDPQAGKFGALTSTLMADSSKPGTAIEAMKTAQPFYSALEHNVNAISQNKMNGEAWLGTLANKPGVKPEELDWTGLRSFLEENKGKPVTKEQVQEHLASNKVELKEVNKGAYLDPPEIAKLRDEFQKISDKADAVERKGGQLDQSEYDRMHELSGELSKHPNPYLKEGSDTKYHSYQLPGGENYREMLMTLPKDKAGPLIAKRQANEARIEELRNQMRGTSGTNEIRAEIGKLQNENQALAPKLVAAKSEGYKSSHWDEPNILAHVRMNDRTIDGKKSLHLEEIQSDWHQQGRDKGYIQKYKPEDLKMAPVSDMTDPQRFWYVKTPDNVFQINKAKAPTFEDAKNYILNEKSINSGGVPDAPFKKTWHELALKRMLREAAEKGYDRLSWTPGEAQAARYDLSKQIDQIKYIKNADGTYNVVPFKNNSPMHTVERESVKPEELNNIVGKEVAQKITKGEGKKEGDIGVLEGLDLKVGGEGMKGFYDQIIPKALEKIGKEHGVKVKQYAPKKVEASPEEINKLAETLYESYDRLGGEPLWKDLSPSKQQKYLQTAKEKSYLVDNPEHPVHYIDIPQSLKDRAMHKGFPLFSGGYVYTPVDGDPFKDKK